MTNSKASKASKAVKVFTQVAAVGITVLPVAAQTGTALAETPAQPSPTNQPKTEVKTATESKVKNPNPTPTKAVAKTTFGFDFEVPKTESKEVTYKASDILIPYDVSGSTKGGVTEFEDMYRVISDLPDDARVQWIGYNHNDKNSLTVMPHLVSNLMPKSEFIKLMDEYKKVYAQLGDKVNANDPNAWINVLEKNNKWMTPQIQESLKMADTPMEKFFEESRARVGGGNDRSVSILQFTDGWQPGEKWDTTLAEYATNKAKGRTMTVVYGGKDNTAVKELTAAGHPNIYTTEGKDPKARAKEIAEQFKGTAIEKVTAKPTTGAITVDGDAGAVIKKATVKTPDGKTTDLTVKDNKVQFSGNLQPGKNTLTVEAEGTVQKPATARASVKTADGKVLGSGSGVVKAYKTASIKVVDDKGAELLKETAFKYGYDGDKYTALKPEVAGYTVKVKDGDKDSGIFADKDVVITYVATPIKVEEPKKEEPKVEPKKEEPKVEPKVEIKKTTKYIDNDSGDVIESAEGALPKKDIPGYKFLSTDDKGGDIITHRYHKIKTFHVLETDGKKEVLKEEVGEKPKTDIRNDLEYDKTVVNEKNGDVTHFYKKKAEPAKTPDVKKPAVKTGANAGRVIAPVAGIGLSGAVLGAAGLVAKRKNKK